MAGREEEEGGHSRLRPMRKRPYQSGRTKPIGERSAAGPTFKNDHGDGGVLVAGSLRFVGPA